jgi:hypothetical protein
MSFLRRQESIFKELRNLICNSFLPDNILENISKSQKFYKIKVDGMNIDIASSWSEYEVFFEKIFTNTIIVEGFKFANLDIVEEFKNEMVKKYNRQKDKDCLEKIKQFRYI